MTASEARPPAVAGAFYPDDPGALRRAVTSAFRDRRGVGRDPGARAPSRAPMRGLVVPHAGYVYSGPIAARAYDEVAARALPSEILILGVDHHGRGPAAALSARPWRTPLGETTVASALLERLAGGPISVDEDAHALEHSIEVQLPFLQVVAPGVPVAMLQIRFGDFPNLARVGARVAGGIRGRSTLVIASTDFSHYVPADAARRYDELARACIRARDAPGLHRTVVENDISMCGIAPTSVLLEALREEPLRVRDLGWGHSGEAEAMRTVVGYAALALESDGSPPPA